MNRIQIIFLGLLLTFLGCAHPQSNRRKDCLGAMNVNDSAFVGQLTLYAGWQDEHPLLIVVPDGDCNASKQIAVSDHYEKKGWEYDHIDVLGTRVVVQLLHRSEGDNSATGFLLSMDAGISWRGIELDAIDPNAEGIQALSLRGEQEIYLELFNLDGPTKLSSMDNGQSWKEVD